MKKPSDVVLKLYENGPFDQVRVREEVTHDWRSVTWVELSNTKKSFKWKVKWSTIQPFVRVGMFYSNVVGLLPSYFDACRKWHEHVAANEAEYKTYLRLKEKFEKDGE